MQTDAVFRSLNTCIDKIIRKCFQVAIGILDSEWE